ncbi:MAG: ABC transporter permease [Chloroflexi bacterium]|nr:ABC transporter permease [Chloroflexota bacterium]
MTAFAAAERPAPAGLRSTKLTSSPYAESLQRFRRDPVSMTALSVFLAICLLSIGAPVIARQILHTDPNRQDLLQDYEPPSGQHWGGTDGLGRDVLTRLLYAGQVSLGIGFAVAGIELSIGILLGLLAGFYHGKADDIVNALILTRDGIPTLYFLILLSVTYRDSVGTPWGIAIVFGLLGWTGVTRQVRGLVLSLKRREYIDAARVVGVRDSRIMFRHILPNVMYVVLIVAGFDIVGAMLGEAGLSYLGLGIHAPTASWGNMLSGSLGDFQRAPWLVLLPGLFISVTVLCIFLIVDGLRDAFDPQQR